MSASAAGRVLFQPLIGCGCMLVAWTDFLWQGGEPYAGLVEGIHLSNQTSVFGLYPPATNRINTIFMTTYFIGGSTGTPSLPALSGTGWAGKASC